MDSPTYTAWVDLVHTSSVGDHWRPGGLPYLYGLGIPSTNVIYKSAHIILLRVLSSDVDEASLFPQHPDNIE